MKKIYTLGLMAALSVGAFAGCTPKEAPPKTDTNPPVENPEVKSGKIAKAGLGVMTSIAKSKEQTVEANAVAQVDTTMAAVGFDAEGKIVSVSIDVSQGKVNFDESMSPILESEVGKTKKELKEEYGMKATSTIEKEWYEQIAALEDWMVGKTVEEVVNMKTTERDASHKHVPDEEDLKSSVTITVESYIMAVQKAYDNAVEVQDGEKVGLGQNISFAKSKAPVDDKGGLAQVDTTIALTVLDKDGKVSKTIIDTAQTKVQYDLDGALVTSLEEGVQTKKELGDKYGMKPASAIKKEWFEQIASLETWTEGKTVEEVLGMELKETVPAESDLTSSVTIKVNTYLEAFKEAAESAK